MKQWLIKKLLNKSYIGYEYYHVFDNIHLQLDFNKNHYKQNLIFYILGSDFSVFNDIYLQKKIYAITDVFIERCLFSLAEWKQFCTWNFQNLFWLRFHNLSFWEALYDDLIGFIVHNMGDVNRVYLERCSLQPVFFQKLSQSFGFQKNILSFLNFDNNKMGNEGISYLIDFVLHNSVKLEYLSLVNNQIVFGREIEKILLSSVRILDISWNKIDIDAERMLLTFLSSSHSIKELYLKNMTLSDSFFDNLIQLLEKGVMSLDVCWLSLCWEQEKYRKYLLSETIFFDIDICQANANIERTVYIKYFPPSEVENFYSLENATFYLTDGSQSSQQTILKDPHHVLQYGLNLFLFDVHDYDFIQKLLEKYHFNYIYLENYSISDLDFVRFISIIRDNRLRIYKINLVSIEINNFQLEYLLNNFPENICMIEINVNRVNRLGEYLYVMVKNSAIIFENVELYRKIFK